MSMSGMLGLLRLLFVGRWVSARPQYWLLSTQCPLCKYTFCYLSPGFYGPAGTEIGA